MSDACSWCGEPVPAGEGYRVYEPEGARRARFCRLEHVVPWAIRGAAWEAGEAPAIDAPDTCAWCRAELGAERVLVVRDRGEHHISDGLCSTAHLLEWAKAGGRYAT